MIDNPQFPIRVLFHNDNEEETFDNLIDAACHLEFFDNHDPDENATVTDKLGKPVHLKVEMLEVKIFKLANTP